jgi:hypothetical protein
MIALLRPFLTQLIIGVVACVVLGGGAYAIYSHIYNKGAAHERAEQKERDDEVRGDAREAIGDVDRCYDAGGVWDQQRTKCVR